MTSHCTFFTQYSHLVQGVPCFLLPPQTTKVNFTVACVTETINELIVYRSPGLDDLILTILKKDIDLVFIFNIIRKLKLINELFVYKANGTLINLFENFVQ